MGDKLKAVIFDWGDTLMRDLPQFRGPMAYWPEIELLPGVAAALEAMSDRYVCCVASNAGDSDAALMSLALERGRIRRYFQRLWTSRELGAAKPSLRFFAAILEKLSLGAAECASVGNDYERDIAPARAVGMKTVWLDAAAETQFSAGHSVINNMAELSAALAQLEAT